MELKLSTTNIYYTLKIKKFIVLLNKIKGKMTKYIFPLIRYPSNCSVNFRVSGQIDSKFDLSEMFHLPVAVSYLPIHHLSNTTT